MGCRRRRRSYFISTFILIFWSPRSLYFDFTWIWSYFTYCSTRKRKKRNFWGIRNFSWSSFYFISFSCLSFRVCFFIYCWGFNWGCFIKFFSRCSLTRYLLCSSSFSLCLKNRCSICINGWFCLIFCYIFWCKFNFFSYTFFRVSWNTSTLFRLS